MPKAAPLDPRSCSNNALFSLFNKVEEENTFAPRVSSSQLHSYPESLLLVARLERHRALDQVLVNTTNYFVNSQRAQFQGLFQKVNKGTMIFTRMVAIEALP
ncbi:hypothetical protein N7523_004212 [Penicillium sp. IBT 18751x]|nr:hypothetical protein N7523_004212 [Penicillium sp. IBT 18751x]